MAKKRSLNPKGSDMKKTLQMILIFAFIGTFLIFTGCSSNFFYETIRERISGGPPEETGVEAISDAGSNAAGYENDFTLIDLDGEEVSLSDFAGKIVMLNFWATWCPSCKAEIPDFIEVYDDYRDKGVQFIGVSDEDMPTLRQFVQEYGINYPILVDDAGIGGHWGVRAIPTTFILGRDGTVLFKNVGMMTRLQLVQAIEDAK